MEHETITNLIEVSFGIAKTAGDLSKTPIERKEMHKEEFAEAQKEVMIAIAKTRNYLRDFKKGKRNE